MKYLKEHVDFSATHCVAMESLAALAGTAGALLVQCGPTLFRYGGAVAISSYTEGMQNLTRLIDKLEAWAQCSGFAQ